MKNLCHGTAQRDRVVSEAREVFHMGSDVDDSPVSQPARSTSMLRANRFSPLSAEIDDEPLLSAVGAIPKTFDFGRSWSRR